MTASRSLRRAVWIPTLLLAVSPLAAQQPAPPAATAPPAPLFAVLFRTGPKWDAAKPPNEQAFFKEHSENLRALRTEGRIAIGARYADVGLILLSAATETEARALIERDASVKNGTFVFEVHEFRPFFSGCVGKP
jgi:hypothetical protein